MSFLSPASLAWLGLLVPLVLLYVLKRRRQARVVGSTLLWELAQRDMRAERPWQRLVPHLSLLLQALVLILGAIALARPTGGTTVPAGARVTVVVDTSASMAAREETGTRMDAAREALRTIARELPPGGELSIVEAASEPNVVLSATADPVRLEAAIAGLVVRGGTAAIEAAVAVAAERLEDAPSGSHIVILTDAATDGSVTLAIDVAVEVQRIGTTLENTAIVAADVRPRPTEDAPDRAEVFVRVEHFGMGSIDVYVSALLADGTLVASRRLLLEPNVPASALLTADVSPDADGRAPLLEVRLSAIDPASGVAEAGMGDALPLDDVAALPSPAAQELPIFVIGDAPATVRRVLVADTRTVVFETTLPALEARRAERPDAPELDGLLVFSGPTPAEVPRGADVVVVAPTGPIFGNELAEPSERSRIVSWDEAESALRFVSFTDVHFRSITPLSLPGARSLVTAEAGPVMARVDRPDGTTLVLGFDPDTSDWPEQPGFVVFFRNVLEDARRRRAEGGIAPGPIGEALRVPEADGIEVVVTAPDGTTTRALSRGDLAIVPVPALPGIYRAESAGGRVRYALRSLLDAGESNLAPRARFVETAGGPEITTTGARAPTEAWPILAGMLLVVLVIEALWATRKGAPA